MGGFKTKQLPPHERIRRACLTPSGRPVDPLRGQLFRALLNEDAK